MTKDRFAASKHAQPNPPVGHYRPKYTRGPVAVIRGKEALNLSPRKLPRNDLPDKSDESPPRRPPP
eukprot:gene5429-4152_t